MGVSENSGTPKSSLLVGFSIINHPFWGTPIFGNTHMGPMLGGNQTIQNVCNFEGFPLDWVSVGNMMNPVISRVLSFSGGSFRFKGKRNLLYQVS